MFKKKDSKEICQNVSNGDPEVAGLWLLFFLVLCPVLYFPSSLQTSTCKVCK